MLKKLFAKKEDKIVKNEDNYTENFMRNYEELRKEIIERQED